MGKPIKVLLVDDEEPARSAVQCVSTWLSP